MAVVHRENFICMKADGYLHPDHETRRQLLTRHYYAITSTLAMRGRMAGYCPEIRDGSARMALVVRECEFTIDHRPVSLRILLAECRTCPDPEPLEPLMHPDPATAEIIYAAGLTALGRLRYYAENDGHLEQIIAEFDQTVAGALDISLDAVAGLTATTPAPTEDEAAFDKLLDASSLGPLPPPGQRVHAQQKHACAAISSALRLIRDGDHAAAVRALAGTPRGITSRIRPLLAELLHVLAAAEQENRQPPPTLTGDPAVDRTQNTD